MWYKQSVKDRMELMKTYKKAYPEFSYHDMVKHFSEGGITEPPIKSTKIFTDKAKYDKAYRSEMDSLNLYNAYRKGPTGTILTDTDKITEGIHQGSYGKETTHSDTPWSTFYKKDKIKPIGINTYDLPTNAGKSKGTDTSQPFYKKPVIHNVYQKPKLDTSNWEQSSLDSLSLYKSNFRNDSDYLSNLSDTRPFNNEDIEDRKLRLKYLKKPIESTYFKPEYYKEALSEYNSDKLSMRTGISPTRKFTGESGEYYYKKPVGVQKKTLVDQMQMRTPDLSSQQELQPNMQMRYNNQPIVNQPIDHDRKQWDFNTPGYKTLNYYKGDKIVNQEYYDYKTGNKIEAK